MTKKQKKAIDNLLKRKKEFAKIVQHWLELQEQKEITILAIVSDSGEFEWRREVE